MIRDDPTQKPTGSLVTDALSQLSRLVRGEVALARAEVEQSLRKAGSSVMLIAAAAILSMVALNVLAGALVAWVATNGLDAGVAALIVGAALAVLALILLFTGLSRLRSVSLTPKQTIENVARDAATLSEIVSNDSSR